MPHGIMTPEQLKIQTEISRNQDRTRHPWIKKNNLLLKNINNKGKSTAGHKTHDSPNTN